MNELPKDFNYETYILLNYDLHGLNERDAISHFLENYKLENRLYKIILPDDFDVETYILLNQDLLHLTIDKAKLHYFMHGMKENRIYKIIVPHDFDAETYILLNPDLLDVNVTIDKAKLHYFMHGMKENRLYKIIVPHNFDWKYYINDNLYLLLSGVDNEEKTIQYYLKNITINDYKKYNNNTDICPYFDINQNLFDIMVKNSTSIYDDINVSLKNCETNNFLETNLYTRNSILKYNEVIHHKMNKFQKKIESITDFNSFILIIDFPSYYEGGTAFFLDLIVAKYKTKKTFFICRKFNEFIKFSVNDEYILTKDYTEYEAFEFLQNNIDKFDKVFINHLAEHSSDFIENILNLNKDNTIITHDHLCITNSYQNFYHNLVNKINLNIQSNYNLQNINNVITQNKANVHTFSKFYEKKNLIISELPDFKRSGETIYTSNDKIIIGVIGAISIEKGSELLKLIKNAFKDSTEFEIILFGKSHLDYIEQNSYSDIHELNKLLIKFKPNILIETSLWPETYSYTLTLAMLTQLPILSIKKNFSSVIEDRLMSYKKKYYFSSLNELIYLVRNMKQNYFCTIEPIIYYNDFWDNYFLK